MGVTIAQRIGNYDDPRSVGSNLRRRRSGPLLRLIEECFARKGSVRLVDVGGMEKYWNIVETDWLARHRVTITLSNLAGDILPIGRPDVFEAREGDGCALPFGDGAFDICHSNSTVEHVGTWSRKKAFAREVRRLAPSYFVQTPNFWFPWEPHFGMPLYHWAPEPTKLWLSSRFSLGWQERARTVDEGMDQVEYASLLNRRQMAALFPDATLIPERFFGLTKSFVALRRAG